ncbi:hypothetical protein MHOCP_23400 [Moorella humiferrea]|uniref:copper amine oxidase N-terminal domain-containing protein n=1 Tax=Neomoorella humiferrea TaxID=676965 RepID=UPI0030CECE79
MLRTRKRWLCALLTLVFIVSFALPAMAATDNRVSSVPTLEDNAEITQTLGSLTLLEDSDYMDELVGGKTFTVTFPSGVKLAKDANGSPLTTVEYVYDYGTTQWVPLPADKWLQSGDYTLDITLPNDFSANKRNGIKITPRVKIDGFDGGDIEVTVDGFDSGITSGTYVLGRVGEGDTTAAVLNVPTIGEEGGMSGTIRITENSVNAIGENEQEITIKLPKGFEWDITEGASASVNNSHKITFLAGLYGSTVTSVYGDGDRTLEIKFQPYDPGANATRDQRGVIQIEAKIKPTDDADFGDIEVELSGDEVSDADLVIAKYADFGISVTADGDIEEVLAGRKDVELTKLYFKENVKDSFVDGRKVEITFPEWVKITGVAVSGVKGLNNFTSDDISINENEVEFVIADGTNSTRTGKIEFKLEFTASIEANASGDIVAEVSGRAGAEGEVVLGKALPPVEVTAGAPAKVSIGKKGQAVADITITESKDGALMENKDLVISLPDGIKFSGTPDVEVVEGNLELDEDGIDADGGVLTIPIKSESSKASTLKITGIEVDLDRTIPSGEVKASIKGEALVENYQDPDDVDTFETDTVVKVAVANVVAPGEEAITASFVIGSSTYVIDGVEYTMDVAPYVTAAGRTYVPVRYLAYALGVAPENVYWDQAAQTVTLLKGFTAVQLTIGSNVLKVNGISVPMDVAPEIKDGRTMLPARFVAEAFGASVGYDAATQTVTIEL